MLLRAQRQMTDPARTQVSLEHCDSYDTACIEAAVGRLFDSLGGLQMFAGPGQRVLIKPNFIAPRPSRCAAQTHGAVILAVARILKDIGAKPFVADSPAWSTVYECARVLELDEPLARLGVPVRSMGQSVNRRIGDHNIKISSAVYDADVIFNLPKFKAHQQLGATFAVKNMFGVVPGKRKALWHFRIGKDPAAFCRMLIDIYRHLSPAVNLIDGVVAMDGPGPIRGRARPLGYLIAGPDPIACEAVCAALAGFELDQLPIVQTARDIGFGCWDIEKIDILGCELPEPCGDFRPAQQTPLRFSLVHIVRSLAKQLIMLLRNRPDKSRPRDY